MCCVALAFDKGAKFGFDKPAGVACRHLTAQNGCAIHAERAARGFQGCIDYDCLGAGQRVTAMFAGRTWREDPAQLRPMLDAFAQVRRAHELLQLLNEAAKLPLSAADEEKREALAQALQRDEALDALSRLSADVRAFLTSLGGYVSAKAQS